MPNTNANANANSNANDALSAAIQAALIAAIRQYLQLNPHAADTAEGITLFWLNELPLPPSAAQVADALAALLASGEVEALPLAGRTVWRRARAV
ncbi:hypothetical protein [Chitinibacter tainanensis]|uniref:hypothetical protein n=1 Tax=Chitinibacter tainanensis TaxID=230667 RepID=UPI002354BA81|nr:hypothetical protein [Chitinibacter tainanensis]